jgi:hypothetical protein
MRYANSKTTLDLYAKAATPSKRQAHQRIVDGLLSASTQTSTPEQAVRAEQIANLG